MIIYEDTGTEYGDASWGMLPEGGFLSSSLKRCIVNGLLCRDTENVWLFGGKSLRRDTLRVVARVVGEL